MEVLKRRGFRDGRSGNFDVMGGCDLDATPGATFLVDYVHALVPVKGRQRSIRDASMGGTVMDRKCMWSKRGVIYDGRHGGTKRSRGRPPDSQLRVDAVVERLIDHYGGKGKGGGRA